jgi:hypothetical protein
LCFLTASNIEVEEDIDDDDSVDVVVKICVNSIPELERKVQGVEVFFDSLPSLRALLTLSYDLKISKHVHVGVKVKVAILTQA